jgi:DNA ligase-1
MGEAGEAEDAVPDVQLLLANKWTPGTNPTGWWMSEKLDGVRAYWNGRYSRPHFPPALLVVVA